MDMISALPPGSRKDPGWRLWEQVTHEFTPLAGFHWPANRDTWHRTNADFSRSQLALSWRACAGRGAESQWLILGCFPSPRSAAQRTIKAMRHRPAWELEGAALSNHGAQEGVFAA